MQTEATTRFMAQSTHTWVKEPQSPPVMRNPPLKSIHSWTTPPLGADTGALLVDAVPSSAMVMMLICCYCVGVWGTNNKQILEKKDYGGRYSRSKNKSAMNTSRSLSFTGLGGLRVLVLPVRDAPYNYPVRVVYARRYSEVRIADEENDYCSTIL